MSGLERTIAGAHYNALCAKFRIGGSRMGDSQTRNAVAIEDRYRHGHGIDLGWRGERIDETRVRTRCRRNTGKYRQAFYDL